MKRIDCTQPIEARVGRVGGETVEGLSGISVGFPVIGQFSEIMIEPTILLRHENDVIDGFIQFRIGRRRTSGSAPESAASG